MEQIKNLLKESQIQFSSKLTTSEKREELNNLTIKCSTCTKCPLAKQGRTQTVFGYGNINTKLMFVGEGPGRDEDAQGKPFVGRAGKLLTKIIEAMKLKREDVYISNVVKCRPPENRTPLPSESQICKNLYLFKEISIIKPQIICTLGSCATQALLGEEIRIGKARGNFHTFDNILVMPTYHPAYLLRNPEEKRKVWEDMQKIIEKLSNISI
ncbi:TPA: uracil-DNA glycosylase [Candidatus Dependentiae bacterium]|nr:MAG: putative phage protein [candidate division TM6 bacterium GW2011_GWE2_31_21]KKP53244.1 MAG: putative phage protein [candidate division TM6 bacterium GW2011_GWF2_33_332]HBS48057.1 uracil-DNA glycosylase [Candidatus Dependentiae bacterium]HBZ73340.1 uracil-DNA glycosylase [Candidatus Dependentiae bacterium]